MRTFFSLIVLAACILPVDCEAQTTLSGQRPETKIAHPDYPRNIKKGSFFLTTYYQYTHFQKLKLVGQTNTYKQSEGENAYDFTSADISEYNSNYKTDYINSLMGVRIGYQAMKGLGVNAFFGVSHFDFRSWISTENTQNVSTKYPAFTYGVWIDYEKCVLKNLFVTGSSSITYFTTASVITDNNSGEEVIESKLNDIAWDVNAALSCKLWKFYPYAGIGFTQQYIRPLNTERIETTDENGNVLYNTTTFDSYFRGDALYGFAGLEFRIGSYLSVYGRSTFVNPLKLTAGLRVNI